MTNIIGFHLHLKPKKQTKNSNKKGKETPKHTEQTSGCQKGEV